MTPIDAFVEWFEHVADLVNENFHFRMVHGELPDLEGFDLDDYFYEGFTPSETATLYLEHYEENSPPYGMSYYHEED